LRPIYNKDEEDHSEATAGSEVLKVIDLEQFSELFIAWNSVSSNIIDLPNPEKRASI